MQPVCRPDYNYKYFVLSLVWDKSILLFLNVKEQQVCDFDEEKA